MEVRSRVSRRGFLRQSALLGVGSALLAACQQSPAAAPAPKTEAKPTEAAKPAPQPTAAPKPTDATKPAAAPAATTAPQAAPAGQVKRGGTLTIAQELDPVSLDPHKSSNFSAVQGFEHVYESLTQYDDKLNVQPALAERWEMAPDGMQYTFHLRKDVKWHDGKEFTAADVKYWHERMMAKETVAPYKNWFDAIERIEVVDKNTARAVMAKPYPPLLATFAAMRGGAIIQEGAAESSNLATTAIGTGPWKLAEYVPQSHLRYVRNPDYWNKELPYVDEVMMKIVIEEDARVAALRAGQIDYAFLSQEGADRVKADRNVTVLESAKAWLTCVQLNTSRKPFDDVRVRQALRLALDPNEVIQKAVSGAAKPTGPVPTGHTDWFIKPEEVKYLKPDYEKAKALLADAGQSNLKFTILSSPQYPEFVTTALVMQDSFKKIGVNAEVQQLEWGTFVKQTGAPGFDYDIRITAFTFYPDPDQYMYPAFHSKGVNNPMASYSNPKVDELLDRGRTVGDSAQRHQIYFEVQKLLEEELPNFWMYAGVNIEALRNQVKGYVPSFTGRRISLKQTWVER
ncbi:MAG: twin-arginine translocation signal domain-containing protein [Chloroflexi bacterium]|nr:twin-arginine translocation signal domain-containing protein [Chloroflexota bacterium]